MEMCHGYLILQECIILFEVEMNATYNSESTKGSNMDLKDPIGNIQNGNLKTIKDHQSSLPPASKLDDNVDIFR